MKHAVLCLILVLCSSTWAVEISIEPGRRAFYRGESVVLDVTVADVTAATSVQADLSGVTDTIHTAAAAQQSIRFRLPIASIKSGEYEVAVTAGDVRASTTIWLAPRPDADRLMVWLWPHQAYTYSIRPYEKEAEQVVDYWTGIGFNNLAINREIDGDALHFRDYAMRRGATICLKPHGGLYASEFNDIDFDSDPDLKFRIGKDRYARDGKLVNPFHPRIAELHDDKNRRMMATVVHYPQIRTAFFNTEVVDGLGINFNTAGQRMLEETFGTTDVRWKKPDMVRPGVVADDDVNMRVREFRFVHGDGLVRANGRTAAMVHRYRPDILTINDPYRYHSLLDAYPAIDVLGTWTYTNPDPKLMLYVEVLRAACRDGKLPLSTVTMLNYPGELAPTKKWMLMGPGRTAVTTWINLSRAPKIIGYYFSSIFDPFQALNYEEINKGGGTGAEKAETRRCRPAFEMPPATYDQIKSLSQRVFEPYGSLISNLRVKPRRVAVLNSFTARLYGGKHFLLGYYPNLQPMHLYTVLAMAQIPADIVFDQTIERFGLDTYDVLVLPKCEVLSESMVKQIEAFRARGGLVVADQYLGPDLDALRVDFDFDYRRRVKANTIVKNQDFAKWDDHIDPNNTEMVQAEGVTAKVDQAMMESYAAQLRTKLDGQVHRDVDCDNPTVLTNLCEANGVEYLFVINDKRDYDKRLGEYKSVLGKLLPQTATISLARGDVAAYDMLNRKRLEVADGSFTVELDELGGTIIALYPKAIEAMHVFAPATVRRGSTATLAVLMASGQSTALPGLQPLEVTITDAAGARSEYSGHHLARGGYLQLPFHAASNDATGEWSIAVTDLTAGLEASKTFIVD